MRWGIAVLTTALVALAFGSATASASASGDTATIAEERAALGNPFTPFAQPGEQNVKARASIAPVGVFAVAMAVRAVTVIRAARVAAAARAALLAARATKNLVKVSKATLSRTLKEVRKLPRAKKALKKAWPSMSVNARNCVATSAFTKTTNWLIDGKIELREWQEYTTWGPRLVPPTETLGIAFPIIINDDAGAGKIAREEVISCIIGLGVGRYFANGTLKPR
jgi:hypothetical protein